MVDLSSSPQVDSRPRFLASLLRWPALPLRLPAVERNLMAASLLLLLLTVPLMALMASDTRLVAGLSTWMKPFKFASSLAVHLGTVALLWSWLKPATRDGRTGSIMARLLVMTSFFEFFYIASQAALGQDSHYNQATLYTGIMFALMGIGAVVLVCVTFAAGVSVLRVADQQPSAAPMRRAVGLGLALSGGLGLATGIALSVNNGHFVGLPVDPLNAVPVFGWSREVGDIRVSHFIGLHALQIMPLAGLATLWLAPARAMLLVNTAAALIVVASLATLMQAMMGLPILR